MLIKVLAALGLLLLAAAWAWLVIQVKNAPLMCERCGRLMTEGQVACPCLNTKTKEE